MLFRQLRNLPSAELANVPPGHWRLGRGTKAKRRRRASTRSRPRRSSTAPARPHRAGVFLLFKAAMLTVGCVKLR